MSSHEVSPGIVSPAAESATPDRPEASSGLVDFKLWTGPMENDAVRQWRARGARVAGFFCAHAPEEILWAAGLLPLRMRGAGSRDTAAADQYLGATNCGFVRHTLGRMVEGDLDFLDVLLVSNSCDHVRRIADICGALGRPAFCHYLDVPHLSSDSARARLLVQLRELARKLEAETGEEVGEEKLGEAIRLYNRSRRLLARAAALRHASPPRLSGSELLAMTVAAHAMPRDRFNVLLEQHLQALEEEEDDAAPRSATGRARLLVVGGVLDDPAYLEVFEDLGADIVADQLCYGERTFGVQSDETIDPFEAIARRMLEHVPCPRMVQDHPRRIRSLLEAVREHRVQGVVCERLKFCDLWGGEIELLRRGLAQESDTPVLVLERDYVTSSGLGQLRTRVQAFLEQLA